MNFRNLIRKNIAYFARYYKLVATAALITVAVITGSLAVGDSVRTTLIKRVSERLGNTETVIFSRNAFMSADLIKNNLFSGTSRSILLSNGFVSQSGRLIPVNVWGVNDMSVAKGAAAINEALAKELGNPGAIVLRLPATGLVPSGSLFVTQNYTTSLRLAFDKIIDVQNGGNISLKNEQTIPLNIFVNRDELEETMEIEGKINLILDSKNISETDFNKIWNFAASGLSAHRKEDFTEIASDRVFMQKEVVETIAANNLNPNRLFSYLANSIEKNGRSIPYSFVTAMDKYAGEQLENNEAILSDYSANQLNAKAGDTISMTYFASKDLKTLKTDTVTLRVKKIVPLAELQADKTLSADFPGLSDVERCTDWDSDLPIDMDLITAEDENYWELYRSTPKAVIAYSAVAGDWSNAYGSATAVRVDNANPDLSKLNAGMFGIQLIYPREAGLYAARNGVDFSSLFLALAFFIIIAAMLLMLVPVSEMLYRRRHETALLKALGYTRKRIAKMLWRESAPVVLLSAVAGVIAGLLYTTLIMWLLGNVWKGATHTDGFSVYPNFATLLTGLITGILISLLLLRIAIVRNIKEKKLHAKQKNLSIKRKKLWAIIASAAAVAITGINLFYLHSVGLFVLVGIILMATAALWGDFLICKKGSPASGILHTQKLIWSTLYASRKQAMLSFFALAAGVFIVFSTGLNRKSFADSSQIRTGTGGYSLWCESSVPIYHNMNTQAGREKLSLTGLPAGAEILQCLRLNADDASCLNLNKVITPTVLGLDMDVFLDSDFQIARSIYSTTDKKEVLEHMRAHSGEVYPALVDATVLTWSLMMSLGDTLHYENDRGQSTPILLAGTLANSIFQGNILMDKNMFSEIWPETTGSEVFLLKVDEAEKSAVKTLLSQALNEYGVSVSTTNDRLKQFNSVTDTYLTIFLTLGGLGLLLGIMAFIIVVRKNLSARRREIGLYQTLGFENQKIEQILYRENLLVPLYAIATGAIGALAGVTATLSGIGILIWLMALLFTVFFVACIVIFVRRSVKNIIRNFNVQDSATPEF